MFFNARRFSPILIALLLPCSPCGASTWLVGPRHSLKFPSQAAKLAKDGDIVLIDAGTYSRDATSWYQNRLMLRGINGRAHLQAAGKTAEQKAIWVIKGNDMRVENIEFSGANVVDMNGAGIRFEGTNLSVRNCHFHHNQMGILTGANPLSDILIEGSEFNDNTVDYRLHHVLGHNIYIGHVRRFTLRHSYVHDAQTGHNVKSRAQENYLLYNRIGDENKASSYLVDFPDGGKAFVIGNQLRQGPDSENSSMLSFAAEHNRDRPQQALYLVNNTFVNDRASGLFVNNYSTTKAILINNLLIGHASRIEGPAEESHNQFKTNESFRNPIEYDYHLMPGSTAIDQGTEPGKTSDGISLRAEFQYQHPLEAVARKPQGNIDVGAFEFNF